MEGLDYRENHICGVVLFQVMWNCANGSGYRQWSRETKGMDMNIEEECK